jgi:TetR/AcrR family transcriptional regulator, transcriptional repressor for nem operon
MPRPRQFDIEQVQASVSDVFTAHGYHGTSINMLMQASGLGKQSLYNALGDKQALYLQAVERASAYLAEAQATMARAANGRAAIAGFFDGLLQVCADPDPARHTCIVSAGLLEGIDDESVARRLRDQWKATRSMLRLAIERGQRDGTVRGDIGSEELATVLMTLISGLRVSARVLPTQKALMLQVLDPD